MVSDCKSCGMHLNEEHPQLNDLCIDCFAETWGELVEKSPMASPQTLYKIESKNVF